MSARPFPRRRVGVDFHTFDGIFQGSRSHLLGIYREAIRLAPHIDFVFLLAEPARLLALHPEFDAVNVRCVAMPHRHALWRLGLQLPLLQRRLELDLLHLQYRLPFVSAGACACTIHDVLFETHPQFFSDGFVRIARWSSRIAVRRSRVLFTVSEFSRQALVGTYGVDPDKVLVTPNGVDRERFFPGTHEASVLEEYRLESQRYVCTVGRLEPRKNHVSLLRAYVQLPRPRMPLVVIGQRDFSFEGVFDEVTRLGLQTEVRFLEDLPDAHLPALMRHARLFAYPSYAEGFGMPVLEALASGVPVITSDSTSLPEVAADAATLVAPDDVAALAEAITAELLRSKASREEGVVRGLRQADRYNWQASARLLIEGFERAWEATL